MSSASLSPEVYACCLPRPRVSTEAWCCRHLALPSDANTKGMFRLDLYPHAREWCACADDPDIEKITIQAASRIGKTFYSIAVLVKTGATNPHPMAFADADEKSTRRVIRRIWRTLERCEPIAHQVPPRRRQASDRVELTTFTIEGAWSGSPATAADYPALIAILNETDKMRVRSLDRKRDINEQSSIAAEADFRKLMAERTKGFGAGSKLIQISTPTLKGGSWIEAERLAGDNRARYVPCPFCNHFQTLRCGNGRDPGGIRFEKVNGKLHVQAARDSAWYECEQCRKKILEEHRVEMLQNGLWVPEGCHIDKRDRVTGTPARPGPHASFGPLSTLHSLLPGITLGRIAQEYVEALTAPQNRRQALRNWVNSWMAETWDPQPLSVQASDVEERMGCDDPIRQCPHWARFVTFASDVGWVGDLLLYYWGACCWGPQGRGQLIDLGLAVGSEQMLQVLQTRVYPHADGGQPLRPINAGIDSGSASQIIYEFCNPLPGVTPLKGSNPNEQQPFVRGGFPEMFRFGFQSAGLTDKHVAQKRKAAAFDLIHVNTERSQQWLEERLRGMVKRDSANWFSIPRAAFLPAGFDVPGLDLVKQLLGDFQDERGTWQKRYDDQDFRDMLRYNVVMAYVATANGQLWDKLGPRDAGPAPRRPAPPADDGRERRGFIRKPSK